MEWALGFTEGCGPRKIELVAVGGKVSEIGVDELAKVGTPTATQEKRLAYEGDFSTWKVGRSTTYLDAFGIHMPEGKANLHSVFTMSAQNGVTVHVPALVLMRAFFKPVQQLLPAMFTPANIDQVSFVDYTCTPPRVLIDDAVCARRIAATAYSGSQDKSIQWLQTSKSARRAAQSVHRHAMSGHLKIDLPEGNIRIIMHGLLANGRLYATKATLVSVRVSGHDSITGNDELFFIHAMADASRIPLASVNELRVHLREDLQVHVTDDEWQAIQPMLTGDSRAPTRQHSSRELLDVILSKLSSTKSWKTVPRGVFSVSDLTSTFRRWTASGRLEKVLAHLELSRAEPIERP